MLLLEPSVVADRVRAALAFANVDVKASPAVTGISYATMQRIVSPKNPRGASVEELWKIADSCGVPRWFMEHGYEPPATAIAADDVNRRLAHLEAELGRLTASAEENAALGEVNAEAAAALTAGPDPPASRADGDTSHVEDDPQGSQPAAGRRTRRSADGHAG